MPAGRPANTLQPAALEVRVDKIASEPLVEHHEEAAAVMAAGYAKATGRVGVCLATSGPGALQQAKGFAEAFLRG
jgi:thiamine pyrophosphate-dependent acetolactate synthase large subunit-like protein